MCGIAGYIGRERVSEQAVEKTLALMKQRGPDHRDKLIIRQSENNIVFLHSRLSIIDLESRSDQPFTLGSSSIIYNGEIYNYIELRNELKKDGVKLNTESDTEVLLHYYLRYGYDCVNYFEGMWSFAICDSAKNILFLSRDRFAEKPLYYYKSGDGIYFGSETKFLSSLSGRAFRRNEKQLLRYLVNGHKSIYKTSDTFYEEVHELPFASNMIIDEKLNIKQWQYWKPQYSPSEISEEDAVDGIKNHLENSVRLRLRSDVPLAFCLSGGVDSSSLVSIAAKKFNYDVTAFSIIDTDARYDEQELIQETVADTGCMSFKIKLSPLDDNISRLKKLVNYHDAPVSTISYFVHSLLSEKIAESGFKIAISGTGADEILSGYYDHFNLHLYEMKSTDEYPKLLADWEKHVKEFVRHPYFQKPDLYFSDPEFRGHIYLNNTDFAKLLKTEFSEAFTETKYCGSLMRNRMMNELFHEVVRVILHEDDLNSMMYSVENRSPFLDKSLFEFACTIPNRHLIKNGYAKYLLREAMKGTLNEKVRTAREKKGFNASINSIIDFKNKSHREFLLSDSPVFNYLDKSKIEKLLNQSEFSNSYKKFLFNFVNAKMFLENQST